MNQTKEVVPVNIEDYAMTTESVIHQVQMIQEVMHKVMKKDEHYGIIEGTEKPTLYKPGAEKLSLTFRFSTEYEVKQTDMPGGHRDFNVVCKLRHIPTGVFIAEGVGSCSTLESKYRYRKANQKCPECGKETIIKGKKQYGGGWLCWQKKGGCGKKFKDGDPAIENQNMGRVEYEDPADYYNTVLKMAKKRAHVDAILTATAASDIFTQDLEDLPPETISGNKKEKAKTEPPDAKKTATKTAEPKNNTCTKAQYNKIFALAKNHWPKDNQKFVESSIKNLGSWFRSGEKLSKDEAGQIIEYFHILIPVSQSWPQISPQKAIEKCKELLEFWKPGEKVSEKEMLQIAQNWDDFINQYQFEQQEAVTQGENQDENPFG